MLNCAVLPVYRAQGVMFAVFHRQSDESLTPTGPFKVYFSTSFFFCLLLLHMELLYICVSLRDCRRHSLSEVCSIVSSLQTPSLPLPLRLV